MKISSFFAALVGTTLWVALFGLSGAAWPQEPDQQTAPAKQSSIVFSGTVSQLGATSFADVPRSAQTIVVRVDSVLKKPAPVSLTRGDNVTVEVKDTDRKSTRLNSSHVANSYAVFCLKK